MIAGIYKLHINIKYWICNYYSNNLIKSKKKKKETENILIDEKKYKDLRKKIFDSWWLYPRKNIRQD